MVGLRSFMASQLSPHMYMYMSCTFYVQALLVYMASILCLCVCTVQVWCIGSGFSSFMTIHVLYTSSVTQ